MDTNTNTVRVTKAQKFEAIKGLIPENANIVFPGSVDKDGNPKKAAYTFDYGEILTFLDKEIAQLAKKNRSDDKELTADQKQNEQYKSDILAFLATLPATNEDGTEYPGATCTEVLKGVPSLAEFQVQKPANLLKQLKEEGKVVNNMVKGRSRFKLA